MGVRKWDGRKEGWMDRGEASARHLSCHYNHVDKVLEDFVGFSLKVCLTELLARDSLGQYVCTYVRGF